MKAPGWLALLLLLSCGGRTPDGSDGGGGPSATDKSALCSLTVGGMSFNVAPTSSTANTLSCTGTINGQRLNCGSGTATLEKTTCSDGFGYVLSGGDAKLLVRVKAGDTWQVGAALEGEAAFTGDITFSHLPLPGETAPEAGSQQTVAFTFQGTTGGQGIVGSGTIVATW